MKKRVKADGTTEVRSTCPLCGSGSYERNLEKGLGSCWSCRYANKFTPVQGQVLQEAETPRRQAEAQDFPSYAREAITRRGFDPAYLIDRFGLWWDGYRICWPTSPSGYARRSIWPGQDPKVITQGPKGLIGYMNLTSGQDIVLVEGDYKAASIPRPWVAVGIQGTGPLTAIQAGMVQQARPRSVSIMLDGGWEGESQMIQTQLWWVKARVLSLPDGRGPDDVDMATRYNLLVGE